MGNTQNGLRVLLPARKSRKTTEDTEETMYQRQESTMISRAESDGHTVIEIVRDTVSSQTMPWERKNLKKWFNDAVLLDMWDAVLVETDRLSRCDDKGWHYIEHFCYENNKRIVTTEGVQFPPRDDSDRYQWIGLKRRARTYWEDVKAKHAQTADVIRQVQKSTDGKEGALGLPPFGYVTAGDKLHKRFVIDPVTGALCKEAFQRISDGETATAVAIWLTEQTKNLKKPNGKPYLPWRVKRVIDMISRRTYLGERNGHKFEPMVSDTLFDSANAAMASRSFKRTDKGGRRVEHGYSGLIWCECGAVLYRHQSVRKDSNGEMKPVGQAKYRCGRGRSGDMTQKRCDFGAPIASEADEDIDYLMTKRMKNKPETVTVTTGGDYGKRMELDRIDKEMKAAMAKKDMVNLARLAAEYDVISNKETAPIVVSEKETGRMYGEIWKNGTLAERRSMLERLTTMKVTMVQRKGIWQAKIVVVLPDGSTV